MHRNCITLLRLFGTTYKAFSSRYVFNFGPDMADSKKAPAVDGFRSRPYDGFNHDGFNSDERPVDTDNGSTVDAQNFSFTEDRKIGVTGAVFLILNKMIGTGSKLTH